MTGAPVAGPERAMPTPLSMDIYRGDDLVESRSYNRDIIKIGRLSSAHLRLEDEKVSRIHSVVEVGADGAISIIDMGSAVGTLVNGQRVNKGPLKDGDEIRVGDTRIVLHVNADQASATDATQEIPVLGAPGAAAAEAAAGAPTPEAPVEAPAAEAAGVEPEAPVEAPAPAPAAPAEATPAAPAEATPAPEPAMSPAPLDPAPPVAFADEPAGVAPGTPLPPDPEPFDPETFVSGRPAKVPDPDRAAVELRFMWGGILLNVAHYVKPKRITVGESKKCDFFLHADDFPVPEFPLVRYEGGEYHLAFTRQMEGMVRIGDQTRTLGDLVRERKATPDGQIDGAFIVSLPTDARASLQFGGVTVLVGFGSAPRKIAVPWSEGINYQFLNLFLLSLFLQLALLITAHNFPYNTDLYADDLFKAPNRFAKFILKAPEPVKNRFADKLLKELNKAHHKAGQAAAKHKGKEGKMGRTNGPNRNTRSAPKAIDINDKDIIANTGIFHMLKKGGSAGLSTVFGKGGLGGDINGALGGLVGSAVGDAKGFGGLGLKGNGTGGGGLSGSTIGVGGIGTKGRGGGLGSYGTGVGGLGHKRDTNISITSSNPVVRGSLSKDLIRRVIHAHRDQIRYCYEQELQSKPHLAGKISVKFVISAAGGVTTAKIEVSTMHNGSVEGCLVSRVRTWQFPKPKGGGIVIVTYPFVFKQAG